jgi:outer membrane protein TolC
VIDVIVVDPLLLPELTVLEKQNPQRVFDNQERVAELQLKQVKALRYPTIRVNTGYTFSDSQSSLGFTTQSTSRGLNYGFSASLNLFDFENRNEKIAGIQIENSKMQIEQQSLALSAQLVTAYQTYLTNLELIDLEEK